jgi:hypothetical protein
MNRIERAYYHACQAVMAHVHGMLNSSAKVDIDSWQTQEHNYNLPADLDLYLDFLLAGTVGYGTAHGHHLSRNSDNRRETDEGARLDTMIPLIDFSEAFNAVSEHGHPFKENLMDRLQRVWEELNIRSYLFNEVALALLGQGQLTGTQISSIIAQTEATVGAVQKAYGSNLMHFATG